MTMAKRTLKTVSVSVIIIEAWPAHKGGGWRDSHHKVDVQMSKALDAKRTLKPLRVANLEPATVLAAIKADLDRSAGIASQLRAERELDRE
jgi:hypothetical protein